MNWAEQMKRDAVAISFPDWELLDDDEIELKVDWNEGYHYSSYTYEDPSFRIEVTVARNGASDEKYVYYTDSEAGQFFIDLMNRGSRVD